MIIAQNSASTSSYSKEKELLTSIYHGRANVKLAKEHLSELMEFYENKNVSSTLIDLSKVYGSFAKLFNFLDTEYYPHAYNNGLRIQAYVISDDLISENLGEKLISLVSSHKIKVKIFSSIEQAESWIKTQQTK